MDYSVLGWINVAIVAILTLPFILVRFNKAFVKTKNKNFFGFIKFLRKLHKPLGILLIVLGLYHGYLALGSIRLHTGTVLLSCFLLTVILGGIYYGTKKKIFLLCHRAFAALSLLMLFIHLVFPSAISRLLS